MRPVVFGRCRSRLALSFAVVIAIVGAGSAAPPEPVVLKEHAGWIGAVAFSPDGKVLATASADNTVKLWDTITWKCTATLKGHTDYVACLAFAPDGKTLVSGSYDRTAIVWDLATGNPRHALEGHPGTVMAVAVRPKDNRVATGSLDGRIRHWSRDSARPLGAAPNHKSWVNAIASSPDGAFAASGSSDNTVLLVGPETDARVLRPKAAEIRSLAFSPDGKRLAAGTRYGATKVWTTETGGEVASLRGEHTGDVWGVAFSADGKFLAAADGDWNKPSDVVLWDTATWKERARLKHTNEVLCVAFHPRRPVVAAGAWDKTVRVWDVTELLK